MGLAVVEAKLVLYFDRTSSPLGCTNSMYGRRVFREEIILLRKGVSSKYILYTVSDWLCDQPQLGGHLSCHRCSW